MVKAPSSNGFNRKYKSWRRGKSTKAKNAGKPSSSLKQQLRGLQRLQKKKLVDDVVDPQLLAELQAKIDTLQEQMCVRGATEKERVNAKKSHKMRFIERQRTTRLYTKLVKQQEDTTTDKAKKQTTENELWKLALDQVYIAHYPLDQTSYLSIFQNGSSVRRQVMSSRLLFKMASQRKRVLERLAAAGTCCVNRLADNDDESSQRIQRVNWIHPSQYERIQAVTTWSTDKERETFGITIEEQASIASTTASDGRFQVSDTAQMILEQQQKLERELDSSIVQASVPDESAKKTVADGSDSDSCRSSDEDEVDPLTKSLGHPPHRRHEEDKSSSDSDSSSDNGEEEESKSKQVVTEGTSASSSSVDESDQSDEEVHRNETLSKSALVGVATSIHQEYDDDDDDFLVAAPDHTDVFANANFRVPAADEAAGDKSKGWATQRQLPGQFRKKQRRR